jgi:S-adenosylmethionine/arginine decarboxylase-like enzyme
MEKNDESIMRHFLFDAYNSYRSRLDDIPFVHEFLEEAPLKLGLQPTMPPFVLPYYNGIVPEDCGISSFVFLAGGHLTLHTFSYRGAFFIDLLSPAPVNEKKIRALIDDAFPSERNFENSIDRTAGERLVRPAMDARTDFGPHLFLDFEDFRGPDTMDAIFAYFDGLPRKVGMTPIIRPYVVRNRVGREDVLSGMTMIAESHISLHVFLGSRKAYFDLFSCSFFDSRKVVAELKRGLRGKVVHEALISRGSKYKKFREAAREKARFSRVWLGHVLRDGKS